MKFAKERVQVICEQLWKWSVLHREKLTDWKMKEGCYVTPEEAEDDAQEWKSFDTEQDHWYGTDRHYWFRSELTVPDRFEGKALWLRVHTGLDEWDDARNPQFLLFVNGVAAQGLDINHREALLRAQASAGERLRIDLQSYTGTIHREFHLLADLEEQDERLAGLYYDLQVPLWGLNRMPEEDKTRLELENALVNAVNLLDLRQPCSRGFYESVERTRAYLQKAVYEELAGYEEVTAACIGHTHIDVAWLWTVDQVRQKTCRSFSTVLELMKEFPDYRFMSSQPKLYTFVKERYPELYEQIRQRVKEGRWEPEGGMWVEADCNLTSGESLVRQFLYGKRFFREEFGVENEILWLPDVFGYSAALPQIMKKCGIRYFMTTKLAWNEFNKIPYDTMNWEGIDGTRIFTHLITTLGVGQPETSFFTTYNGMLHPDAIMGGWNRYQNKDINSDLLVCYGYGDGGGGPTRTMLETSERMKKGIKGIPRVRQEFAGSYFHKLEERVKDHRRLPTWVGELYFEYHRGTYTSMARNKRSNRKSEFCMMELELLSLLAMGRGMDYPRKEIDRLWEIILTNQFHDILPGSSIQEVYEVTRKEYRDVEETSGRLLKERLESFCERREGITVWNTLGFERDEIVRLDGLEAEPDGFKPEPDDLAERREDWIAKKRGLPEEQEGPIAERNSLPEEQEGLTEKQNGLTAVTDGKRIYPVQKTENGAIAYVKELPSKGYVVLRPCAAAPQETPFRIQQRRSGGYYAETPFYNVEIDSNGRFTSLLDKENSRQVLKEGAAGNELRIYEDKPLSYSNWNVDIFHQEKSWMVEGVKRMEWTEEGPVRATLVVEREEPGMAIRQSIHFYAENRRIDFDTYVDWKLSEHLLKVHFPVDVHTDEAVYDIQFGNVSRKLHTNTSWDVARFEVCGHKWADLSEADYGVSLMNDCKYGYSMKDRVMTLTLIKSGTNPNPTTDQEEHFFTYSLYPHSGSWRDGGTVREAMSLNVPLLTMAGAPQRERFSFMSVDRDNVILETVKLAEDGDGVIVRLYEVNNARTTVRLKTAAAVVSAVETDLLENTIPGEVWVQEDGLEFTIKPYEIKTFRIRMA